MNGNELKKEFGDYQTPNTFSDKVCDFLKNVLLLSPEIILEPTSGVGNFIQSSLKYFNDSIRNIYAIEINQEYCKACKDRITDERLTIFNDNFFTFDLSKIKTDKETLIIGNPPWATNSNLDFNLPTKSNFKGLTGTDAITGSSNFDICEYIILKLIDRFKRDNVTIAMLCKTSVARNIYEEMHRTNISLKQFKMINFDSNKIFKINAPACLLVISFDSEIKNIARCECYDIDHPQKLLTSISFKNGMLFQENNFNLDFEGKCQLEWRQGVKHDCSQIMELKSISKGKYVNKLKQEIILEDTLVFPLLKSSSFKKNIISKGFNKYVIVTQKKVRQDTSYIEHIAPLTWKYLNENVEFFYKRKSSIYNGAPAFSMFGIGDYSYSRYKVGISGFYKKPIFSLVYNEDNLQKPVMLDDTTYFLSFDDYELAYVCMLVLNNSTVQEFLYSISFKDAKRPYTKKVLQRLDLNKALKVITLQKLEELEKELGLAPFIKHDMFERFKEYIKEKSLNVSAGGE